MKIKWNWGTGIVIFFIIFFLSVIIRIVISFQYEVDLISPDYYPKGVNYQQQITKINNAKKLEEKPGIKKENKELIISFPKIFKNKKLTGEIVFYCPSDLNGDINMQLNTDTLLEQRVDITNFKNPRYILKIDWVCDSIPYYYETEFKNN